MSMIIRRLKETVSSEERLKKQAQATLDIADKLIIEMKAQQVNIKKCLEYQENMINRLHKTMDGAIKIGNKGLYIQAARLAQVVGNWHAVTKQMMLDESSMIDFIAIAKSFYTACIEYRQVVKNFSRATKDFVSFKKFGLVIPKQMETSSTDAAKHFAELANSIASIKEVNYTKLTDLTFTDDEKEWPKKFDEERRMLMQKTGVITEKRGD